MNRLLNKNQFAMRDDSATEEVICRCFWNEGAQVGIINYNLGLSARL